MKTLGRDVIIEEESLKSCSWPVNKIVHGNALTTLKKLPDESVDCVITSPPYFGKRDYGEETIVEWKDGEYQLGLEPTPEMFVEHLIEIFKEVKRVLKSHGNVFVVMDDTYAGGGGWNSGGGLSYKDNEWERKYVKNASSKCPTTYIKHIPKKSLCLVPELFAIRMVYDLGFILRQKLVWAKKVLIYKDKETVGNAMPESVKDRNTHTFEFVYHFVKSPKYYYNQLRLPYPLGANAPDVIQLNIEPFPEAHFAVFPERLVEFLIKVGCPEQVCRKCGKPRERIVENGEFVRTGGKRVKDSVGISEQQKKFGTGYHLKYTIGWTDCGCSAGWRSGVILDPFLGSGTTALVALKMARQFVGIELNREYCEMAMRRIKPLLSQLTLLDYS